MTTSGPWLLAPVESTGTAAVIISRAPGLPAISWLGPMKPGLSAADVARAVGDAAGPPNVWASAGRAVSLLPEVGDLWFGLPGLAGHRLAGSYLAGSEPASSHLAGLGPAGSDQAHTATGAGWTTRFQNVDVHAEDDRLTVHGSDAAAALTLSTEAEALPGGLIRLRHTLTNEGASPYCVNSLDMMVPVDERCTELLDLTGRWGRERSPQRGPIADGVWLRESRTGKPGPESVTLMVAGLAGFGFGSGSVWGAHLGWSGNSRQFLQRQPSGLLTLGGGELLLPGELILGPGQSYSTPWLFVGASDEGLDGLAEQFHDYQRSLAAHPALPRPVISNVWEAVYFDHDLARLQGLATQAAAIGIELFVLDDGWFAGRRNDSAGLGDWTVSEQAWPDGLSPLINHVQDLEMQFGLWFEPEMVNPDSDLYRNHPDWILGGPEQPEFRNQLVLDLGRAEVFDYLLEQIDSILSQYPISYVKWDHNRSLADASSGGGHGGAGVHAQTVAFYALLDELHRRHPDVQWESCASGGARIDLGVLQRVQRVWTSDMTDALSRQQIQRWTAQLVAPEYLGSHVSAPENHQTKRILSLDFRAATAFFGSFGVEWDISTTTAEDRARLADWIAAHQRLRRILHSGRMFRVDTASTSTYIHGVISADRSEAVCAYVQLDETVHDPEPFLVPRLDAHTRYAARQVLPTAEWRGEAMVLAGAALGSIGLPAPARGPLTATVIHLQRAD